jgi:hypothetical protein
MFSQLHASRFQEGAILKHASAVAQLVSALQNAHTLYQEPTYQPSTLIPRSLLWVLSYVWKPAFDFTLRVGSISPPGIHGLDSSGAECLHYNASRP